LGFGKPQEQIAAEELVRQLIDRIFHAKGQTAVQRGTVIDAGTELFAEAQVHPVIRRGGGVQQQGLQPVFFKSALQEAQFCIIKHGNTSEIAKEIENVIFLLLSYRIT